MPGQSMMLRDISDVNLSGSEVDESVLKFDSASGKMVLRAPDKVYAALLTQAAPEAITSGALVVGMRYTITTFETGDDFTNVGAAENDDDVVFIATGTTPTIYTNGSTLTSDGAPIATVLENTLGGTVVWSYTSAGVYVGTLAGAFTANKTMLLVGQASATAQIVSGVVTDTDTITIYAFDDDLAAADDLLSNLPVYLKVYP